MRQRQFYRELEKYHNWNAAVNTLDASFFAVAFACIMPSIIVVAYLKHFTDNKIILNLPVFISNFAFAFGPLAASFFSGRLQRKKRAVLTMAFLHRLFLIPVVLAVYYSGRAGQRALPLFLGCYILFYMIWGLTAIFWREMIGRALHPDRFTTAMGMRESVSGIVGFLGAFLAVYILGRWVFPNNYVVLFVVALVFLAFSYLCLTALKEATYTDTHQVGPRQHLRNILSLPVRNPAFRWYAVFILFTYGTLFIGGLYTAVGIDRFGSQINGDRLAGIINIITLSSAAVFAVVLGRIYDRFGKFWGFLPVVVSAVLLPWWAFFCHQMYGYLAMFGLMGIMWNGWFLELSTELGFSDPERRHETIAFMALVKVIPIVVFTNVGGLVAQKYSPQATFAVSSGCCLVGLLILVFKVRPWWHTHPGKNTRISLQNSDTAHF